MIGPSGDLSSATVIAQFGGFASRWPDHPITRFFTALFDFRSLPAQNRGSSLRANPTSGGVTASTEMLAAKRHAGVHTPAIACKMIIANQQMAYAA